MALNSITTGSTPNFRRDQLMIGVLSAAILLVGLLSTASQERGSLLGVAIPTLCGFKLLTTWDCPGCGLTRSLILALHGQWAASYALHLWGIPLMGILLFQIPYRFLRFTRPDARPPRLPGSVKKWISPAIFLSILLPWIARTIAGVVIRYL